MKRLILAICCLVFFTITAWTQHIIKGQVISESDTIMGALVQQKENTVLTDSGGFFCLTVSDSINITLIVSGAGYNAREVEIDSISPAIVIINLERERILVKKPVIYLYSDKEIKANIKIQLDGKVSASYPQYDSLGWNIMAKPGGEIKNLKDNRLHSYLYWEGQIKAKPFEHKEGFIVKRDSIISFLESKLSSLGLTNKEANDFISYWIPSLSGSEYVSSTSCLMKNVTRL